MTKVENGVKKFSVICTIFLSVVFMSVTLSATVFALELYVERVTDDPQAEEIYALTEEIAEWANDYVGEEYFTAESVSFDKAYKVYSNLLTGICESPESAGEHLETEDYSWFVYLEYEDYYLVAGIHMGNGVNMDSTLGEILRGEREGTEDELLTIENLQKLEGHYYVSSMGGAEKIVYEDIISSARSEGVEGDLYFSGAAASSPAGILINGDDVSVKYYEAEVAGVTSEVSETPIIYFYIAIAAAVIAAAGLIILFVTRKKRSV